MKRFGMVVVLVLILSACASRGVKPKVGECFRKDNENYREKVYKVIEWEADGAPRVRDLVTTKIRTLLDYEPKKYRVVDCPS